ncbi:MAG: NUDIX domain-containing protein [Aristaeellaceae bacterium]
MEQWDLYTVERVRTGQVMNKSDPVPPGLYHMQVHVVVFDRAGRMLIQQQTERKQYYPGLWDYTVGGRAQAGESSAQAAEREVREEIGLTVHLQGVHPMLTRFYHTVFDDYYIVQADVAADALTLQSEEVQAVRWATRADIYALQKEGRFCPNPRGMIDLLFDLNEEGLPW